MTLSRREFLRAFGASTAVWLLPSGVAVAAHTEVAAGHTSEGMLVDLTRCIGCGWCYEACKRWHALPPEPATSLDGSENQPSLSARNWTVVQSQQVRLATGPSLVFVKRQCMHCLQPACGAACLTAAMKKTPEGPVVWREDKCMGCRFCMVSCPFDVPKFEFDSPNPEIRKCDMCFDRLEAGEEPACVAECPTGALTFGTRSDLLEEAASRIYAEPDRYVHHIYGEHEAGGTSFLYLAPVPFEQLGFPTSLSNTPYPTYTREFLYAVPLVLTVLPPFLFAVARSRRYGTGVERESVSRGMEDWP